MIPTFPRHENHHGAPKTHDELDRELMGGEDRKIIELEQQLVNRDRFISQQMMTIQNQSNINRDRKQLPSEHYDYSNQRIHCSRDCMNSLPLI